MNLSPDDSALIGREAGIALRWMYRGVAFERLPDRFEALLAQLAEREGQPAPDSPATLAADSPSWMTCAPPHIRRSKL